MNSDAPQNHPQRKGISRRGFIGASLSAVTGLGLFGRKDLLAQASPTPKSAAKIKDYSPESPPGGRDGRPKG